MACKWDAIPRPNAYRRICCFCLRGCGLHNGHVVQPEVLPRPVTIRAEFLSIVASDDIVVFGTVVVLAVMCDSDDDTESDAGDFGFVRSARCKAAIR